MTSKRTPFIRILSYLLPSLHWFLLGVALVILINASELAFPYIIKVIIDDYLIARKATTPITLLGIIYFGVVLAEAVGTYTKAVILNRAGQDIIHRLRLQLFGHLQHLPLTFFDHQASGRLVTRVTNDIEALNEMFTSVVVTLLQDSFMLLGIVIIMLKLNVYLAILSVSVVVFSAVVVRLFNTRVRKAYSWVRQLIGSINAFVAENIAGMKIVQIFRAEQEKFQEFQTLNHRYQQAMISRVLVMGFVGSSSELINNLAICLLLWISIPQIFQGTVEIGVLFAFISYAQKLFKPINNLAEQYTTVLSASVAAERIFEVLDTADGLEDLDRGQPFPDIRGKIEFKNVWFAYDQENWVLKDISFTVNPGEMVAFVGATGSGKTTIMNILGRFYEIQRGEILLDGVNIKDIRLRDLRRHVAVVMQDVFLFSGDIQSNIRLNNIEIPFEAVQAAAQYVNAHQFIQALPGGYVEEVKERGCTLSTGQRQLLAFARAITFRPRILVLDEATAHIDTQTELIIQDSLDKISKNLTMLVVAHRLSTIQHADKIIVIHKGHIREIGTHAELLAKGGIYSRLYHFQYAR